MSELREDPFTGRWSVIAEGRSARPNEHATRAPVATSDPNCPFCEGHEDRTPPEVAALRAPGLPANGPGWTARAIPNKFPSLGGPPSLSTLRVPHGAIRREGSGIHQVVIETPTHSPGLPNLDAVALRPLFRFFRDRVAAVEATTGIAAVELFENWGPESGGTLWHPHAQIAGFGEVPPVLASEAARFAASSRCLLESVTESERSDGSRLVAADERFSAYAPFGSEHPYELRIVPRSHRASFADASDDEIDGLAALLPRLLRAIDAVAPRVSYNWWLHGAGHGLPPSFHWHVEITPRIVRPDGFELGSGLLVNPVPPETAATQLRAAFEGASGPSAR